jgi:hypothetical protein
MPRVFWFSEPRWRLVAGIRLALISMGRLKLSDAAAKAEIAIVCYLLAHPDARDTLEGIEKWWLPVWGTYGAESVAAALERLMDRSLVVVWRSATAKPVYGLASSDSGALRDYLRALQQSSKNTCSDDENLPS